METDTTQDTSRRDRLQSIKAINTENKGSRQPGYDDLSIRIKIFGLVFGSITDRDDTQGKVVGASFFDGDTQARTRLISEHHWSASLQTFPFCLLHRVITVTIHQTPPGLPRTKDRSHRHLFIPLIFGSRFIDS
jgi:hypothetical protein